MGDVEEARTKLAKDLSRMQWYGVAALVFGAVGAMTPFGGLGAAVAVVGFLMIVGAAFAKGYYLGHGR